MFNLILSILLLAIHIALAKSKNHLLKWIIPSITFIIMMVISINIYFDLKDVITSAPIYIHILINVWIYLLLFIFSIIYNITYYLKKNHDKSMLIK